MPDVTEIAYNTDQLYRLLIESVDDYAIFALDPDGYILSWNPGAERFKGYKAHEAIGKHFSIFYLPERVAEGFPAYELREAARVGRFEDEGWRVRKDGSRFWANVVLTALHDPSGRLVGYAKVTRDLTERRQSVEELRISEERFRLLVHGVRDYAIFMLDPAGIIATWNEGAQRIKGYSANEIIGKHFSTFYPAQDVASGRPSRELEVAARTGTYEEEGWRVRKDGSRLWASVLITAIRNDSGTLVGFAKVTRDLTERRLAEERALADSRHVAAQEAARKASDEARTRAELLQSLTASLSATHSIAEILRVTFEEGFPALGVEAGALTLVDEEDGSVALAAEHGFDSPPPGTTATLSDKTLVAEAIAAGQSVVCRSRSERDSRFPELSAVLAPFESSAVIPLTMFQRTTGAISMHRREQRPLDDATLQLMEAFARQVAQSVDRARLYDATQHARARADEANRAKSEFLAAMSHEFRTPLNAIGGYADLMDMELRDPVTAQQREYLQRIKRSQQHLLGVINDILNFSRIEAGQTRYEFDAVAVGAIVDDVQQMIAPQITAKGLELVVGPCPPDMVAWVDRSKLDQILLNLLSNAVKFTTEGSIDIRCGRSGADGVTITVRDTGGGIPADQLGRIFEPFVQVGRSLTASHEGTGLGLAISRDLARAMGGEITVESTVGAGSAFTVFLRRAVDSTPRT